MEKTLVMILVGLAFVLGIVGGAVFAPTDIEYKDKIVEELVYQNVSVDKIVEIETNQLELAVAEFLKAVENEEDEAGNSVDVLGDYNFDEIEVSKVYDDYTVEYDGSETIVNFSIKLRFDDEDAKAVKETFDVQVIFEEDEDTEVTI